MTKEFHKKVIKVVPLSRGGYLLRPPTDCLQVIQQAWEDGIVSASRACAPVHSTRSVGRTEGGSATKKTKINARRESQFYQKCLLQTLFCVS